MAINSTANWRIRGGGNNANGSGFDASISGALSTTLNGGISSGATSMTVASATGWPGSGSFYARIGNIGAETFSVAGTGSSEIVHITSGAGTTTWTIARGQLGTTAQAFVTGVVVDNDISRCNTALATGITGTSNNSTTFTATGGAFNAAYVGNCLWLASGTNGTVGPYFITAVASSTSLTLDRNCSTAAMTNGVWKIGGAWVDPYTNVNSSANIVPGNSIFIRASGLGTTSGADYVMSAQCTVPNGNTSAGAVRVIGENGRPFISGASISLFYSGAASFYNLYLFATAGTSTLLRTTVNNADCAVVNCILDQNGLDLTAASTSTIIGCEIFSSVANAGATGSSYAVVNSGPFTFINNNVHDTWGPGVYASGGNGYPMSIVGNIISKTKSDALELNPGTYSGASLVMNNTLDGGAGHGINVTGGGSGLFNMVITYNIISNFATAGKYGIYCNINSTAVNDRLREWINNNCFYNNTVDAYQLTVGSTTLQNGLVLSDNTGVDPQYVSTSTENYAIGTNLKATFSTRYINSLGGMVPSISYVDPGGVQRQEAPNPTITVMS